VDHLERLVVGPEDNVRDLSKPVRQTSANETPSVVSSISTTVLDLEEECNNRFEGGNKETSKPMVPFRLDVGADPNHGVHAVVLDQLEELDNVVSPFEVVLMERKASIMHGMAVADA
jgi:hypothetical protein